MVRTHARRGFGFSTPLTARFATCCPPSRADSHPTRIRLAAHHSRSPSREFYLPSSIATMSTDDQITGVLWSDSNCSTATDAQLSGHVHGDVLARRHDPGGNSIHPRLHLDVSLVVEDGSGSAVL